MAGGDNQYRYGEADPANVSDPTGECPWCVAFALCMAECGITTAVINAATGECNNWGNTAKDCAIGCAAGMGLGWLAGQGFKWLKRAWDSMPCAVNSFPADTQVHVKPGEAKAKDAKLGKSTLRPIGDIKLGDEVLAFSEWKDKGKSGKMDRRLSYEKVTDVYTSYKAQTLVRLKLDDGQTLTATEGHPFKTTDGWRDAILLKKGGKLLLKGGDDDDERTATITDVRTGQRTLPVYNLEVANGHTYFVGINGELVHNANCTRLGIARKNASDWRKLRNVWDDAGYGDILSDANRKAISKGRTPKVDEEWIKAFPEDAGLKGERIPMHHIQGSSITVPLPETRHLDAHMPGGFRYNPGGPGSSIPFYR